jgi:hypothetical protein
MQELLTFDCYYSVDTVDIQTLQRHLPSAAKQEGLKTEDIVMVDTWLGFIWGQEGRLSTAHKRKEEIYHPIFTGGFDSNLSDLIQQLIGYW